MANLPKAVVALDAESGAFGTGDDIVAVLSPTPGVVAPRVTLFASTRALLAGDGYMQGASYCSTHFDETKKATVCVAIPIAVAGTIYAQNRDGVTGTAAITVEAVDADVGPLEAMHGILVCTRGGTVGTDALAFDLSLDGGHVTKGIRTGTALSYTPPYVGIRIVLPTGKTLAEGDRFTFRTTAPRGDADGVTAARLALAARNLQARSLLLVGDLQNETEADAYRAALEAYAETNDRFVFGRCQVRDQHRPAVVAALRGIVVGAALTFAEVGGTADTITRAGGSWITDGFAVGDTIVVSGSASNNVTAVVVTVSATVLTLGADDLAPEVTSAATVKAYSTLTFDEAGTITRSSGSFVADGFKVGTTATIEGSTSNDGELELEGVSATVLTVGADDLVDEVASANVAAVSAEESNVAWRTAIESAFDGIGGESAQRIDLAAGYGAKRCPLTGWRFRRPAAWGASLREYQHDVHIPCWRVEDGPLAGWTLEDPTGQTVEHDERVDGGLLAARFTCLRTWNNEVGCFVALSLTRADEGTLLSRTHNMAVANVCCAIVQKTTQRTIGQTPELNEPDEDGNATATEAEIVALQEKINTALAIGLLDGSKPEGKRASGATWTGSRDDVLNIPGATVNGAADLDLNGTIEQVATRVRVPVGG